MDPLSRCGRGQVEDELIVAVFRRAPIKLPALCKGGYVGTLNGQVGLAVLALAALRVGWSHRSGDGSLLAGA